MKEAITALASVDGVAVHLKGMGRYQLKWGGLNGLKALVFAMEGFSINRKDGSIANNEDEQWSRYLAILLNEAYCQQ